MEATTRNWGTELENVNAMKQSKYVRLKTGVPYAVTFLDEGGVDYPTEFDNRTTTRIDFKVRVLGGEYNNEDMVWSVTKGGRDSLYGKLCKLFSSRLKAAGYTVHVIAQGEGKEKKYSLKEFNDLLFTQQ
jgi:hypothetical protein